MGDPISVGNVDGGDPIPSGSQIGDPISAGNLVGGGGGDPISAGNLDGVGDPISAGNLDWGGSHICRKPRWGDGIPYLQET